MGEEDGTFRSAARRLAARGVACGFDGLLGGSRADDAGDAVEFLEERPLRDAGEDIANVRNWGERGWVVDGLWMGLDGWKGEQKLLLGSRSDAPSRVKWFSPLGTRVLF